MKRQDGRKVPHAAQAEKRLLGIELLKRGKTVLEVAKIFQVSRRAVEKWRKRHREEGKKGLRAKTKGRPKEIRLSQDQSREISKSITDKLPEQLKLPYALWTREAVKELIWKRYKLKVSISTVGRYLQIWGFSPQKPVYKAYEQQPMEVKKWLEKEYPSIKAQAKRDKAEIHWCDEVGMRSDHQAGRTYAPVGKTPVIKRTGKRFRLNMISSLTNKGTLRFMIFREGCNAKVFLRFLRYLIKSSKHKIYLIADGHPAHKTKLIKHWLEEHKKEIQLFYLPAYSPELNPDELVNQDIKTNVVGKQRTLYIEQMEKNVRGFMTKRKNDPEQVMKYFHEQHVQYAA